MVSLTVGVRVQRLRSWATHNRPRAAAAAAVTLVLVHLVSPQSSVLDALFGGNVGHLNPHYDEDLIYGQFPSGFKWGAATAAYQVLFCLIY